MQVRVQLCRFDERQQRVLPYAVSRPWPKLVVLERPGIVTAIRVSELEDKAIHGGHESRPSSRL